MEEHGLVEVFAVVIVPVHNGRGLAGGIGQRHHRHRACYVGLAGRGHQAVAHDAHDGAGHDAEVLFQRGPALNGAGVELHLLHPAVDHRAQLRHLEQRLGGDALGLDILVDLLELGRHAGVVVGQAGDAAKDLGEVKGLDGDAALLQQLLAEAHGVECLRACANGSDAGVLEAAYDTADGPKAGQVGAEFLALRVGRVRLGERVLDAVLLEIVAVRHLAAERVATVLDRHVLGVVGECLEQDGHVEFGPAQGVGDGAFVAEVGQRDQHAVDLVAVGAEEVGAAAGFLDALDGPVARLFGREGDDVDALFGQHLEHGGAARVAQVRGKEAAVADDQPQRERFGGDVHKVLPMNYMSETYLN